MIEAIRSAAMLTEEMLQREGNHRQPSDEVDTEDEERARRRMDERKARRREKRKAGKGQEVSLQGSGS